MNNYTVGMQITDFFAVRKASIIPNKNGFSKYLDLRLHDGQQEIPAKQWDYTGEAPRENTVIKITAMVNSWQGQPQLIAQKWEEAKPGECDSSKFIPVCVWDKEDLLEDFFILTKMVKGDYYSSVLQQLISGPLFDLFTIAPGAKSIHHAYLHGLLEHSVDVAKKTMAMSDTETNRDLIITGGLLHDIGKIEEYDWSGCTITKTTKGRLIGHIGLGLMILDRLELKEFFDQEKHMLLAHLIASHHGKPEMGALVEPQTREAVILHTADMLDFQFNSIDRAVAGAEPGSGWTARAVGIGREFYVGKQEVKPNEEVQEIENH